MKKFIKPVIWTAISVLLTTVASVIGYKVGYKTTESWLDILDK